MDPFEKQNKNVFHSSLNLDADIVHPFIRGAIREYQLYSHRVKDEMDALHDNSRCEEF